MYGDLQEATPWLWPSLFWEMLCVVSYILISWCAVVDFPSGFEVTHYPFICVCFKRCTIFWILILNLTTTSAPFKPCFMQQGNYISLLYSLFYPVLGYANHKSASALVAPGPSASWSHTFNKGENRMWFFLLVYCLIYLSILWLLFRWPFEP